MTFFVIRDIIRELLLWTKRMTIHTPKKTSYKIENVELLRPWVVKIPYTMNGRRLDLVIYKEETGWFSIRVNEFYNKVWIKIKSKDEILPKRETNRIYENKEELSKKIAEVLDYYVGKKRLRIPQKVEEAYELLMQEKKQKIEGKNIKRNFFIWARIAATIAAILMAKEIKEEKTYQNDQIQTEKGMMINQEKTEKTITRKNDIDKQKNTNEKKITKEKKQTIHTQTIINQNFTQDEVFGLIEQPDPKIDPNRYANRMALTPTEKQTVKDIYIKVMGTTNKEEIIAIINNINNIKITRGLRDILVKKTYLLQKKGVEVKHLQIIGKQNVTRERAIIDQDITKTREKIKNYNIEPGTFDILFTPWTEEARDLNTKEGTIQIYFVIQHNEKNIGKISFDTDGNLLTNTLQKNNIEYELSQNGTNIQITEGYLAEN